MTSQFNGTSPISLCHYIWFSVQFPILLYFQCQLYIPPMCLAKLFLFCFISNVNYIFLPCAQQLCSLSLSLYTLTTKYDEFFFLCQTNLTHCYKQWKCEDFLCVCDFVLYVFRLKVPPVKIVKGQKKGLITKTLKNLKPRL